MSDDAPEQSWQAHHPVLGMVVETVAGIQQQENAVKKLIVMVDKLDARVSLIENQLARKRKRKTISSSESKRLNASDENDKAEGST